MPRLRRQRPGTAGALPVPQDDLFLVADVQQPSPGHGDQPAETQPVGCTGFELQPLGLLAETILKPRSEQVFGKPRWWSARHSGDEARDRVLHLRQTWFFERVVAGAHPPDF